VTQRRPFAEIFLDEWGTSGKKQPDLAFLLEQLGKAELFRAADYVADLMKGMIESVVQTEGNDCEVAGEPSAVDVRYLMQFCLL
jgi:hypothetical protein